MIGENVRKLVAFGLYFGAGFLVAHKFGCFLIGEPSPLIDWIRETLGVR